MWIELMDKLLEFQVGQFGTWLRLSGLASFLASTAQLSTPIGCRKYVNGGKPRGASRG
jgi:hypothetical protein